MTGLVVVGAIVGSMVLVGVVVAVFGSWLADRGWL